MSTPVRRTIELLFLSVALFSGGSSAARAESAYYQISLDDLKITEGELPASDNRFRGRMWMMGRQMLPYAVLDGEGEIYLGDAVGRRSFTTRSRRGNRVPRAPANAEERNEREQQRQASANAVAVHAPEGKEITGALYVQKNDLSGLTRVRFRISADRAGGDDARRNFLLTKEAHYQELVERQFPGGAWFRYQAQLARSELAGKTLDEPVTTTDPTRPGRPTRNDYEDTFQVFSGGRAISENLQLDRLIQGTKPEEESVEISSIKGITVKEMDWAKLTKGINPELDPLARVIPADQHALFMPSFEAMVTLMDEAKDKGTPILHLVQRRAESAQSKERYEKQLCLEVDALSRLLGPQVISSVAFTGSDPYLRTGTDVAVIFEAKSKSVLTNFLATKHATAASAHADAQQVKGQVAQANYSGVVTPDRRICSYTATLGNAVVVTNSLAQLERLARTHEGQDEALGTLPEYQFFRERYPRGDSTGLLVVTDQTIRRWCSPKWRIATSRRTRAAAILAHHQAVNLTELVNDSANPQTIHTQLQVADLGTLKLTEEGVTSSTYGSLDFQTPIIELDLARVTPSERDAYDRWRNGYESYWRQFFDPIAVSFSVEPGRIGADVTVMPLIDGSDYNDFIRLSSGASIKPDAGDRHAGTLAHWAMAINVASQPVQRTGNFARAMMPGLNDGPFSWMGESIAVYADPDPFWLDLAKAEDPDKFFREEFHRLPFAFQAEVSSGLKLTVFLTSLRAFVQQAAPDMIQWETLKHNERSYVRISPTAETRRQEDFLEELAIYYAATPSALVVTLNEDVLKRALDRMEARKAADKKDDGDEEGGQKEKPAVAEAKPDARPPMPWLGTSMALQLDRSMIDVMAAGGRQQYQQAMQRRCWANLVILNEWKRRFAESDPVQVQEEFWQTVPNCPGGGKYVWNADDQTMESTVYGSPVSPKTGPNFPAALEATKTVNFGVTFENDGLRARMELEREPTRTAGE